MLTTWTNLQGNTNLGSTTIRQTLAGKYCSLSFLPQRIDLFPNLNALDSVDKLFSPKLEHLQKHFIIPNLHLLRRIKYNNPVIATIVVSTS